MEKRINDELNINLDLLTQSYDDRKYIKDKKHSKEFNQHDYDKNRGINLYLI
jgi:hypothetical protein